MRRGLVIAAARGLWRCGAACDDHSHTDIGDEINILMRRNDALVPPATERLAAYGRNAIPQIETAMHTAAPIGRLHLIAALDTIGDAESAPVLRHVAVYDVTPEVRDAAEALLPRWAAADDARRARARDARRRDRAQARRRRGPAALRRRRHPRRAVDRRRAGSGRLRADALRAQTMAGDRGSAGKTSHRFATTRFANGFGDTGFSPLLSLRGPSTNVLPSSEARSGERRAFSPLPRVHCTIASACGALGGSCGPAESRWRTARLTRCE